MDATMKGYLETPELFGFHWVVENVSKRFGENNSDLRVVGQVPIPVVDDLPLFDATFPGVVLSALDGSSIRVQAQAEREFLVANPQTSLDVLKVRVMQRLQGAKRRTVRTVEKRIYCADDGTEFEDKNEMLEYNTILRAN